MTGPLPEHPDVRQAVGVDACLSIEALVGAVAIVIAFQLCAQIAPAYPWPAALGGPVVRTVECVFRARGGRAWLPVLHGAGRPG
ncbi:hypothetical protein [Kocuria aegyptia]|uniref:Uncharacterized protein n=1 Tax=Kocuria aegyptia TaxID=330943 RepID=A0ABN2KJU9_9MICC